MLLGIDIGTSSCKVAVFEDSGSLIASASEAYPMYYPAPGWVEQDPREWWDAVVCSVRRLLAVSKIDPKQIKGIGVDGQSWAAVAIDNKGSCLDRTPIWMDTRAAGICIEIERKIGADRIFKTSGNRMRPTYSTPKILWCKREHPDIYTNAAKFLQSNSFIVFKLTGVLSQDVSQGYGLHFFDNHTLKYDQSLAESFGIDLAKLPKLFQCAEIVGTVTAAAATETGLTAGTPVVAGGLDAACGALGAGVHKPGETQEQAGQAGGMSICADFAASDPNLISSAHVVPGVWLLQGGTVGGGSMRWLREELWPESDFDSLARLAADVPACSDGLIFLPYMAGERSPIWRADAKSVFYGLSYSMKKANIVKAVMEGTAYSLEHNLRVAEKTGVEIGSLVSVGGAAKSAIWTQIKSDVTGRQIDVCSADSGTTFGAAILAGLGTGVLRNVDDILACNTRPLKTYTPNAKNHMLYQVGMDRYIKLLDCNAKMF